MNIVSDEGYILRYVFRCFDNGENEMGKSKAFKVKVGVHHDSVFSPLLFIIVLKALSSEFREGFWNCFMWMILY